MANGTFNSPLVTLGAIWLAGNNERGRDFTGGLNGKSLLAGGFGAASAEWAGDQVSSLTGGNMVGDQMSQVLAGAAISYAGRNTSMVPSSWSNPIAAGIHYNVVGQAFNEVGADAGSLFGGFMGGGGGGGGGQQQSTQQAQTNGSMSTSNRVTL